MRIILAISLLIASSTLSADAMARLTMAKLEATHQSVVDWQSKRKPVAIQTGFDDVRAILHCHSKWSHDSRSEIDEILAGAKAADVRVIMFNEHPADHYDFVTDGHQGNKDGVLLIPGAELNGMLAFPRSSLKGMKFASPQEQSDMINRTGGLAFISHLEERMDWSIAGITGTEMYNTHADAKEEKKLYLGMVNPLFWLQLRPLLEKYPQEVYASLLDYPKDYLKRFDELCAIHPHTGVAANDAHHNIGVRIIRGEKDILRIEDALGEKIADLEISKLPFLAVVAGKAKPGDVVLRVDMDPYDRAFKHTSTHLLLREVTREAVWESLEEGRAYVSFDWICDPTGFVFQAERAKDASVIGSIGAKIPLTSEGLMLRAVAPLPAKMRLLCDGELVKETEEGELSFEVEKPGIYRVEAWLMVGDELRPWILSNPIYVRPSS